MNMRMYVLLYSLDGCIHGNYHDCYHPLQVICYYHNQHTLMVDHIHYYGNSMCTYMCLTNTISFWVMLIRIHPYQMWACVTSWKTLHQFQHLFYIYMSIINHNSCTAKLAVLYLHSRCIYTYKHTVNAW